MRPASDKMALGRHLPRILKLASDKPVIYDNQMMILFILHKHTKISLEIINFVAIKIKGRGIAYIYTGLFMLHLHEIFF